MNTKEPPRSKRPCPPPPPKGPSPRIDGMAHIDIRSEVRAKYERERFNEDLGAMLRQIQSDNAERKSRMLIVYGWNFIVWGYFLQIMHMLGAW